MTRDQRFILTGAFGSGKSTLLQSLRNRGFAGSDEFARQILAEQRSIDGNGLPNKDNHLFIELMLSRALYEYRRMETAIAPVFFDRGIPDLLGYASLSGFDYPPGRNAATKYRYNQRVFFVPAWEQIYTTDEERKASFQVAREFGDNLRAIYVQLGYELIDIPCVSVEERVDFILSHL